MDLSALTCYVDLHLHLDGGISPAIARKLAALQGIDLPASEEELRALLQVSDRCASLDEFLEKFAFPCSLLQTADGIREATRLLLTEEKEAGVQYAELRFAPQKSTDRGLTQAQAVEAALEGIAAAPIPAQLILCCIRGEGNGRENRETVAVAGQYLGKGVCALDIAGAEKFYPNNFYADLFALSAGQGIPFVAHAGEASGPASVWAALAGGAARIGHGVRAVEDPALVAELAARGTPLELCPTSNLQTAAIPSLAEFPLRAFLSAGIPVTVNTDDPAIEGTDIRREFSILREAFSLTPEEIASLLRNAANASFAPPALKEKLLARIEGQLTL